MLDLTIKETNVYKEIKEEGREEERIVIAKRMLSNAVSAENVAAATGLDLKQVTKLKAQLKR